MKKLSEIALFITVAAAALAVPRMANAASDETCQRVAEALCGSENLKACAVGDAFWNDLPKSCQAYVQTALENEREARGTAQAPSSFSCGGILRSRPSMQSRKVASVASGQEFDSVEDTGLWTDGYKWFLVRYNGYEGYQWGGIFWTEGGQEGTIPSCDG